MAALTRFTATTPAGARAGPASERESAVLVLLYDHAGQPHLVLTRRARHLRTHAHEVAFPGGGREPADADLWHTALREAEEEIGLGPASVRKVGSLDPFVTVGSRSLVHPFVGVVDEVPLLRADPREVESILHVEVGELLRDEVWREEIWPIDAQARAVVFFELVGDTVWGATAAMLRQLLEIATGVHGRPRPGGG